MPNSELARDAAIAVTPRYGVELVDTVPNELRTNAYAIASGRLLGTRYFVRGGLCHTVSAVTPPRPMSGLRRVLALTIYNPAVVATISYAPPHTYTLDDLRTSLIEAVERDDDILTQWHEGSVLIEMLRASATFDDFVATLRFAETPSDDEAEED